VFASGRVACPRRRRGHVLRTNDRTWVSGASSRTVEHARAALRYATRSTPVVAAEWHAQAVGAGMSYARTIIRVPRAFLHALHNMPALRLGMPHVLRLSWRRHRPPRRRRHRLAQLRRAGAARRQPGPEAWDHLRLDQPGDAPDVALFSGVCFSSERFPGAFQPFIHALPLTQLVDALRAVILEGQPLWCRKGVRRRKGDVEKVSGRNGTAGVFVGVMAIFLRPVRRELGRVVG